MQHVNWFVNIQNKTIVLIFRSLKRALDCPNEEIKKQALLMKAKMVREELRGGWGEEKEGER